MVKYLQIRSSKESRESRKTGLMLYARTYRNCIRPNDRSNSCVHRNVSREGYITCLDKPIRCPGNNVPFQRIFKNGENVKLAKRNEFELQSFYRCARCLPKSIGIKTMTFLFVDKTETGTSGRVFGIVGYPANRYFLVDKSNANLFWQAIIAVSGRIEIRFDRARNFRFRFRC